MTREEAGISYDAIRRRLKSGKWQQLFPGVYLTSPAPPTRQHVLAAACIWAGRSAVISFRAAGRLYGFPGLDKAPIELTTERDVRATHPGVVVHKVASMSNRIRAKIGNIPVTTPTDTILDLAAVLDPGQLQAVIHDAIRRGLTTWHKLMVAIDASPRGRRGLGQLRQILTEGLDSHLERLLKRIIDRSRLPKPEVHYEIWTGGTRPREVDFAYPAERVAIEADGWASHSDGVAFEGDRKKWRQLAKVGWLVLPFTYDVIKNDPDEVVETIASALANGRQVRSVQTTFGRSV